MSVRERRIISAMTPDAETEKARLEAEGKDPITKREKCEGVDCGCAVNPGTPAQPGETGADETGGEA
jgi:hypothetical protein